VVDSLVADKTGRDSVRFFAFPHKLHNLKPQKEKMYRYIDDPEKRREKRIVWAATRSVLETDEYKRKRSGKKSKSRWPLFVRFLRILGFLLKTSNYYQKGYENAKNIEVNHIGLEFARLPKAFHGFKILHISDLHLDSIPGFTAIIIDRIRDLNYDICVMTGDYRKSNKGSFQNIIKPFMLLSRYIKAKEAAFATLGNHDSYLMAEYEEESGIRLLINESVEIERAGQKILITGTDDPYRYYTIQELRALETSGYDFKIALVHTSELYDLAAENNYDLYLCGHTHGGQICLFNGKPLITHQYEGSRFVKGLWYYLCLRSEILRTSCI
jgi:uncharacterized protein